MSRDQMLPDRRRDLVGRVAAEAAKSEPIQVLDDLEAVGEEALAIGRAAVVELRQVMPHDPVAVGLDTEGDGDRVAVAHEPIRVLMHQCESLAQ